MPRELIETGAASMADWIQDWWAQLLMFAGVVMWAARLEGRSTQNTKDLVKLEERLMRQRAEDIKNRSRDWDQMQASIAEIQSDIKKLLAREN